MHAHFCKTFIIINCLCRSAQLPKTELNPVTTASDSIAGESCSYYTHQFAWLNIVL